MSESSSVIKWPWIRGGSWYGYRAKDGPRGRRRQGRAPSAESARGVERSRREDRGAEGAEMCRVWGVERGYPLLTGRGLERGCAPSQKIFNFWAQKGEFLVHSGTDKTYFWSAWRLDFLASSRLGGDRSLVDPPLPWMTLTIHQTTPLLRFCIAFHIFIVSHYKSRPALGRICNQLCYDWCKMAFSHTIIANAVHLSTCNNPFRPMSYWSSSSRSSGSIGA